MELVFESRSNFSEFSGALQFVQWEPEIHPEPVLLPDTPVDRLNVSAYGSVIRDGGLFRMWYQATPQEWDFDHDVLWVGCAESHDGYHWRKRKLGVVDHPSGDNHLCDLGLHSPSVFLDPASPPDERYRAVGCGRPGPGSRGHRYGYYSAVSADGFRWRFPKNEPQWEGGDVITSVYHPGRGSAVIALKRQFWINGLMRRCVHVAEYRDSMYSDHHAALYPDEYDDLAARQRGAISGDYYGMAMMPAGQGTVGWLWNFRHRYPYSDGILLGNYGSCDVTLVYQEKPGGRWLHLPGRPDFISHRQLGWTERGWIHTASAPVEVGDEHRLYFSGRNYEHGFGRGAEGGRFREWVRREGRSGITFARWPKDRLFGFETPRRASFRVEVPVDGVRAVEIYLNYRARKGGRVRVGVEGVPGRTVEEGCDLSGDAIRERVVWHSGAVVPIVDGARNLHFTLEMEMAAVYAYEVVPV